MAQLQVLVAWWEEVKDNGSDVCRVDTESAEINSCWETQKQFIWGVLWDLWIFLVVSRIPVPAPKVTIAWAPLCPLALCSIYAGSGGELSTVISVPVGGSWLAHPLIVSGTQTYSCRKRGRYGWLKNRRWGYRRNRNVPGPTSSKCMVHSPTALLHQDFHFHCLRCTHPEEAKCHLLYGNLQCPTDWGVLIFS